MTLHALEMDMASRQCDARTVLRGVVVPLAWSDAGEVTAVGVSTFDEQEYFLESAHGLETWLKLLRQKVELVGGISGDKKGSKVFCVDKFKIIKQGVGNE